MELIEKEGIDMPFMQEPYTAQNRVRVSVKVSGVLNRERSAVDKFNEFLSIRNN
jgi:hypothetical protein